MARPSQICTPRELVFPKAKAHCLSAEIESLLQKEAISPICPPFDKTTSEHGFVSQLFLVPKKDGGIRAVVNLKALNSHVQQVPFKMEGIHLLKDILRPGDWMTKVDLKDAYFSIPVRSHDRKFLRFRWQGKMYQFNCLPFGLSSAPWIFTKATKPVVTILRTLGMRITIFINDSLVMAPSKELAQEHTEVPDFSVGEPRVHPRSTEIFDRPHTGNRLPGSRCRLRSDGAQITGFKDQEHPVRCQSAAPNGSAHGSGSVKTAEQVRIARF